MSDQLLRPYKLVMLQPYRPFAVPQRSRLRAKPFSLLVNEALIAASLRGTAQHFPPLARPAPRDPLPLVHSHPLRRCPLFQTPSGSSCIPHPLTGKLNMLNRLLSLPPVSQPQLQQRVLATFAAAHETKFDITWIGARPPLVAFLCPLQGRRGNAISARPVGRQGSGHWRDQGFVAFFPDVRVL